MLLVAAEMNAPFGSIFIGLIFWLTQFLAHPQIFWLGLITVAIIFASSLTEIRIRH